jgi:hypothetical protein
MLKRKIKLLIIVLLLVNTASVKSVQSSSSVIQTYYEPAIHYDDLELCNGQGVYKGGKSKLQEQLDALKNYTQNKSMARKQLKEDEVVIYPNPATAFINIEYNFDKNEVADFVVYDLLGREYIHTKLYGNVKNIRISTLKLLRGMYLYKIVKKDNSNYTGKLIIE